MKIAFVSDDHQTISAHFGKAQFYEVYTFSNGRVNSHESILKPNVQMAIMTDLTAPTNPTGHPHMHDHLAMIAPIEDCEALVSRGMGKGAHNELMAHDIQPIITDIEDIPTALEAYISGKITNHPERLH